jgi:GT2 family glycosyltransferase
LIAGEEPELCVRLRHQGWKVWRLAQAMAWHDAAMFHFRQWWLRAKRGGYAAAEGASLHGAEPERHGVAQTRRALLWGAALPLFIIVSSLFAPLAMALWLVYPLQTLRLALRDGIADRDKRIRALFYTLARFPEAQGVCKFWLNQLRRRRATLIEYK